MLEDGGGGKSGGSLAASIPLGRLQSALLPMGARLRKRLLFVVVCTPVVLTCVLFAGPLSSGALFLLVPPRRSPVRHDLPEDYEPLHKGGVDLPTGLYTRENEDLVVNGTPALILRRTYLSGYRISKQFGIGATHPGEEYLIGDPERFQWAALIPA